MIREKINFKQLKKYGNFIKKIRCCFVCIVIILAITGCEKTIEQQIAEQLELGQKYFAEQDYEQALVAFNKMIEIDPKQWDAYVGIAEIYEAQGKPDQAVQILEQGLGVLREEEVPEEEVPGEDIDFLVDLYRILADQASQAGDMELTQTYYQKILELRPEMGDIQRNQKDLEKLSQYEQRIREFVQDVTVENESELIHIVLLGEEIVTWIHNLKNPVFLPAEDKTYIGLYPKGNIYSGEMENGIRQGYGLWISPRETSMKVAAGTWIDDKPNGRMTDKEAYGDTQKTFVVDVIDGIYTGAGTLIVRESRESWERSCEYDMTFLEGKVQQIPAENLAGEDKEVSGVCKKCGGRINYIDHDVNIFGIDGFDEN